MNKFMNFREEGKICAIFQRKEMEGKMMYRNSRKKILKFVKMFLSVKNMTSLVTNLNF